MRVFASESNLIKASVLAAVVTVISVGRLVEGGKSLGLFVPAIFLLMTFIAGAVTAWGQKADMAGIVTSRQVLIRGIVIAALISAVALPAHIFWLDPVLRNALAGAKNPSLLELSFPPTNTGRISLVLWMAGFQVMFLVAAPMSLFARLTNRQSVSFALCIALRAYLTSRQVALHGVGENGALLVLVSVCENAAQCFVFARNGLAPAMLLAAGLQAHVFFPPR